MFADVVESSRTECVFLEQVRLQCPIHWLGRKSLGGIAMVKEVRKIAFWATMLAVTWLCVEALSFIAYGIVNRSLFSYREASSRLDASIPPSSLETPLAGLRPALWGDGLVEALHPYFGFVADPTENRSELRVSDFGFPENGNRSPIVKRSSHRVIVALFGGSFSRRTHASLKSVLNDHSAALGKEFIVINFAADGYKQPQQLMVLNYFLALGAEFDVVINLDGFNEVALPASENVPYNVNPFYPRKWDRRTATAISPSSLRLIGYSQVIKESRARWARVFRNHHFYLSPTLFSLWQFRDDELARVIYETNRGIETELSKSQSYTMRGPSYVFENEERFYRDLVEFWKRCSLQMNNLSQANGARYYHFLQPNQYVEGSKPMSEAERRQAVNKESPFADGSVKGYPLLIEAGRELQSAGVQFSDLTMVFSEHREALYTDDCCHTNREGTDIVANRIYETIYAQ